MKLEHLYLLLTVIGLVTPFVLLMPWIGEHGMALGPMFAVIGQSPVSQTVMADLLIAAVAGTIFIIAEGMRAQVKFWWVAIIGTYSIGFCFGLPLFLYLRQRQLSKAVA